MKKLFLFIALFFSFYNFASARISDPCYRPEYRSDMYYMCLEQQELEQKISELQTENTTLSESINTLNIEKLKLENQIILLEKELWELEKETIEYFKKELEILQAQKNYTQNMINITKDTYCWYKWICSSSDIQELVTLYENKISALDEQIDVKQKEIDEKIAEEEQKLQAEKELQLQQEREQKAEEYFQSAEKKLIDGDIKSAISSYVYSCSNKPSYECYYALSNAYFLLAQEYYKNISSYGYDRLYKEQINKALENLEKALELVETDKEKVAIDVLKNEIENYPNKEEKENIEAPVQDTTNTQVEFIWSRIEKLTSSQSEAEKEATYKLLITKLQEYINKSQDANLKAVLTEIVERLKNTHAQEEVIAVYDRTEGFYKTTLQEKTYSCEISATSDILSAIKNKDVSEDELIEQIDKSMFAETAQYSNGIYIWWNPNNGFVWYIDTDAKGNIASQRNLTGYGVYEAPITKLYNDHWVKTEILNNSHYTTNFWPKQHLQKLLEEFTKWNYIQLWGDICTTPEYDDGELALADITQEDVDNGKNAKNECWSYGQDRKRVWYYEDWEKLIKHQGLIWEHNFYLLGYEWDIDSPVNIIVWDTSTGKHTYPVKEWMRKWEEMDFRSIIIYSK